MKNFIIIGPTASKKSKYASILSNKYNIPCINFDSKQFFKDLGTLTSADDNLFSKILTPDQSPSLGWFWHQIKNIQNQILVGGSMFYAYNMINGINICNISEQTKNFIKSYNAFELLSKLDSNHKIHKSDILRTNRYLEVIIETGYPLNKQLFIEKLANPYVILIENKYILENIIYRLNDTWDKIISEVINFQTTNKYNISKCFASIIGLQEIKKFLNNEISLQTCKDLIITKTYQYAKYQMKFIKNKFMKNNLIHEIINTENL